MDPKNNRPWAARCAADSKRPPRILVIGHGRHGKDTAAAMLAKATRGSFVSSSEFAAQKAVFPLVSDLYPDWKAAYADRANHRELWYHAIRAYNLRPGPTLTEQILADHDIYVGMRSRAEFERSRNLFDLVIWVDRSKVLPPEQGYSMELTVEDADWVLDNNRCLKQLEVQTVAVVLEYCW
ncbi:hypothetical protein [Parasedimentitalea maritima]|uniref:Deoxynucleotide monophosphate kinase n=1 Tax=Parasedimentitalea maritima TaxID=2578117 RepID=A0A6A4RJS3_9RHOB|nr:hypothetical protein [Zongyanglinia marina]KAE9629934.1 hypothetical protein GP644_09550 [Zongyanglinia marina]